MSLGCPRSNLLPFTQCHRGNWRPWERKGALHVTNVGAFCQRVCGLGGLGRGGKGGLKRNLKLHYSNCICPSNTYWALTTNPQSPHLKRNTEKKKIQNFEGTAKFSKAISEQVSRAPTLCSRPLGYLASPHGGLGRMRNVLFLSSHLPQRLVTWRRPPGPAAWICFSPCRPTMCPAP